MSNSKPRIVVVGSINMDLVVRCHQIPTAGETVLAETAEEICGGKGANQAVASSRSGAEVALVGRVGDDAFQDRLMENLRFQRVEISHVQTTTDCSSGLAVISVDDLGENSILVVPGANGQLTQQDVLDCRSTIESCDILMLQMEVPLPAILTAAQMARDAGVRVILDPAPAPRNLDKVSLQQLLDVDLLCPNESEAAVLVGHPVKSIEQAKSASVTLQSFGAKNVAITMGEQGTVLQMNDKSVVVPAFVVQAVDTTAAGDAFAGALAFHWAAHGDLVDAVAFANAAGGLAASKHGAQPSLATGHEIETLWRSR